MDEKTLTRIEEIIAGEQNCGLLPADAAAEALTRLIRGATIAPDADTLADEVDEVIERLIAARNELRTRKIHVHWTADFKCEIEVPYTATHDDIQDALANIDIPEGGNDGSTYVENTFDIRDYYTLDETKGASSDG